MKYNEIVRKAMRDTDTTQKELAEALGYKSGPSAISVPLSRSDIYASTLINMLDALGYEVVVRPRNDRSNEMTLTNEPESHLD